ncbi:hypothetical protein F5Y16DRAFT_373011 [Xylariaceae sp. FL0255]|nr:hypothetical protein F5Y16DRAFT_373011 [Xylariaceae sp. FL0255]
MEGNQIPINYLSKAQTSRLRLIHGDGDTFSDVLGLINEYEGVLNRHESLAFNLGAKLTGARLLKAMEGAFEGSIMTNPPQSHYASDPVTWLDIVNFARSNPQDFQLSTMPTGMRCCQFPLKGTQVEIGEDDWRLIKSGALDRFKLVPPEPLEEDETAEVATLDILEQRLQVLIKKADEVAGKARQLNYHLSGRKASIHARHGSKFQSVNPAQAPTNPGYDVHADLLQQFMAPPQVGGHRLSSVSSLPPTPNPMLPTSSTSRPSFQQPSLASSSRPSPSYVSESQAKDTEEEYRTIITSKIEQLPRGNIIRPPCDRCRRLKTSCVKHLTACQGCTKKHTKCTWKKLTEEEIAGLSGDMAVEGEEEEEELRDPAWRRTFSSGPGLSQRPGLFNLRAESDRGDDTPAARVVVNRHHDDVWRKGPSGPTVPNDSMDIDSTSSRMRYAPDDNTGYTTMHVRQVASAASAHADATAASRETQHRQ